MESIEFDIARGTISSDKVDPWRVVHESKWRRYATDLATLRLPPPQLSRFLEKVCTPPCLASVEPLAGWKQILPCLHLPIHWDLPIACWNETEKALRDPQKRPALVRGLTLLRQEAPEHVADWLRFSPHNLCRNARRLGMLEPQRARRILEKARLHPIWSPPGDFEHCLKRWTPLRVPEWLSEGLAADDLASLSEEFLKRQPLLQLDLLYRLLKS